MLTIDGRTGGGQLLRTALSLSALTGTPFTIEDVRASRPRPGLKPQHLSAIRIVSEMCDAAVDGATTDSEEFSFEPGPLEPTSHDIDIGTAGSVTLLFDAVLPFATDLETTFEVTATGGTDVKWSPTIGYLSRVKLALLGWFGLGAGVEIERTGFYPAGGGRATLLVRPTTLEPLDLVERGPIYSVRVYSKASAGLADAEVAERQANRAAERLDGRGLPVEVTEAEYVDSISDGSSILLRAAYPGSVAGFDALGERGKPSETVADEAVDRLLAFHDGPGAVDQHMGDQLLVFLALAGGSVEAARMTDHIASNAALINRFGFDLRISERADGAVLVEA